MDFFDHLNDTVVNVGKEVGQKAKDVTGVTKLRCQLSKKQNDLGKKYMALGKEVYKAHMKNEEFKNESTLR